MGYCPLDSNVLFITLQPNEGFTLTMDVKAPGDPLTVKRIPLHFRYNEEFGKLPDAYETLIVDVLEGDQTLFVHSDEVEAAWRLYTPVLERDHRVFPYPAGSWGPKAVGDLLARGGHTWRLRSF
jgi:glucose-6-phosphate 1-dehydrogenase